MQRPIGDYSHLYAGIRTPRKRPICCVMTARSAGLCLVRMRTGTASDSARRRVPSSPDTLQLPGDDISSYGREGEHQDDRTTPMNIHVMYSDFSAAR